MKKILSSKLIWVVVAVLAFSIILAGCGQENRVTLKVYNWGNTWIRALLMTSKKSMV